MFIVGAVVWVPALRNDGESWDPMGNFAGRPKPDSLVGMSPVRPVASWRFPWPSLDRDHRS